MVENIQIHTLTMKTFEGNRGFSLKNTDEMFVSVSDEIMKDTESLRDIIRENPFSDVVLTSILSQVLFSFF